MNILAHARPKDLRLSLAKPYRPLAQDVLVYEVCSADIGNHLGHMLPVLFRSGVF